MAPGASVICLRERSNSPKPKRFFPGTSTDTDGASTGPAGTFAASSAMLRPRTFGNCVTDGTLGGVAPAPESEFPPLPPQDEAATASAAASISVTSRINRERYEVGPPARVRNHTALTSHTMRLPFQQQVESKLYTFYALTRAGFVRPERPDTIALFINILVRGPPPPAASAAASAARYPTETGIEDELGTLSFRE